MGSQRNIVVIETPVRRITSLTTRNPIADITSAQEKPDDWYRRFDKRNKRAVFKQR